MRRASASHPALTSKALHLHNHRLRASPNGSLRFIRRWRAKIKYANFTKPEEITSEVALTLTPPEAQCSPTDILDQRPDLEQTPAAVEHVPMYEVPADVIWTPPGVVNQIPAEAQCTPTLNQPSKVMAAELVEQKPTAAEYAPMDEELPDEMLTTSCTVDQTVAEAQHTPTEVVNQQSAEVTPTDAVEQRPTEMQYPPTDIEQTPVKAPLHQRPATPRRRACIAQEATSTPSPKKRGSSSPPLTQVARGPADGTPPTREQKAFT